MADQQRVEQAEDSALACDAGLHRRELRQANLQAVARGIVVEAQRREVDDVSEQLKQLRELFAHTVEHIVDELVQHFRVAEAIAFDDRMRRRSTRPIRMA